MSNRTLIPFHAEEGLTLKQAAVVAGKSERRVREWCTEHGIGRRIAGGAWTVSKVALLMLLEDDRDALVCYRDHGVRASYEPVARYFRRANLAHLLDQPEFAV